MVHATVIEFALPLLQAARWLAELGGEHEPGLGPLVTDGEAFGVLAVLARFEFGHGLFVQADLPVSGFGFGSAWVRFGPVGRSVQDRPLS